MLKKLHFSCRMASLRPLWKMPPWEYGTTRWGGLGRRRIVRSVGRLWRGKQRVVAVEGEEKKKSVPEKRFQKGGWTTWTCTSFSFLSSSPAPSPSSRQTRWALRRRSSARTQGATSSPTKIGVVLLFHIDYNVSCQRVTTGSQLTFMTQLEKVIIFRDRHLSSLTGRSNWPLRYLFFCIQAYLCTNMDFSEQSRI